MCHILVSSDSSTNGQVSHSASPSLGSTVKPIPSHRQWGIGQSRVRKLWLTVFTDACNSVVLFTSRCSFYNYPCTGSSEKLARHCQTYQVEEKSSKQTNLSCYIPSIVSHCKAHDGKLAPWPGKSFEIYFFDKQYYDLSWRAFISVEDTFDKAVLLQEHMIGLVVSDKGNQFCKRT